MIPNATLPTTPSASSESGGQAAHLRQVAARAARPAAPITTERAIVLFGAKGGVGVSSVAMSLARELASASASQGTAVLAVDAHWGRNDLDLLTSREGATVDGLAVTSARQLGVEEPTNEAASVEHAARRLLAYGKRWTDDESGWLVIDAGVGGGAWPTRLAANAERPMLVTTADDLSLLNGYRALKRLVATAERTGVVVNHAMDAASAEATHAKLARSCQKFLSVEPALAGWLPTLPGDPTAADVRTQRAA